MMRGRERNSENERKLFKMKNLNKTLYRDTSKQQQQHNAMHTTVATCMGEFICKHINYVEKIVSNIKISFIFDVASGKVAPSIRNGKRISPINGKIKSEKAPEVCVNGNVEKENETGWLEGEKLMVWLE